MTHSADIRIANAVPEHIAVIHKIIDALAEHLRLGHELVVTEENLHEELFDPQPQAEVALACVKEGAGRFCLLWDAPLAVGEIAHDS